MQMSGHKPRAIFDRYHIVSEGDLREAARKLTDTIRAQSHLQQLSLDENDESSPINFPSAEGRTYVLHFTGIGLYTFSAMMRVRARPPAAPGVKT
jgi:hypothetical protein